MRPVPATPDQVESFPRHGTGPIRSVVVGGPEEGSDVIPCPALIEEDQLDGRTVVHVLYDLAPHERQALIDGDSLVLTCYGGLPIHKLWTHTSAESDAAKRQAIFEAIGAASVCWEEYPSGVFDSTQARKVANDLCEKLGIRPEQEEAHEPSE